MRKRACVLFVPLNSIELVYFSLSKYKDMGLAISSRYLLLNHSAMEQQKPWYWYLSNAGAHAIGI